MKGALLVLAATLLAACSAEPGLPPADAMTSGYLKSVHEQGATGMSQEQLLAAGQAVCAQFGNMAKPDVPYSLRYEAYGLLYDGGLIPDQASSDTADAILASTSFLCLNS